MTNQEAVQQLIFIQAHTDHEKGLHTYAFLKLHNHATEEDLVQETFMKAWNYLIKGGTIVTMKPFLYHILNNLIIDEYRRKRTDSLDGMIEAGFTPSFNTHENDCIINELAIVFEDIHLLPEGYRTILRMHYIEHRSLHEIALITGQTKNALSVQMFRGVHKLRLLATHQ